MASIELAPEVTKDFDRIIDHLTRHEADDAPSKIHDIIEAISILERNPLIGRPANPSNRELVIGQGSRGYVALYRHVPELDTVFILAVRGQREAGYGH